MIRNREQHEKLLNEIIGELEKNKLLQVLKEVKEISICVAVEDVDPKKILNKILEDKE